YELESQGGDDGEWEISHPFSDVSVNAWYNTYVAIAYSLGIINGKSADRFDPDANMTLAEAAKIAAVIHQFQQTGETYFPSYGSVWYQPYVDYCYDAGIISQSRTFNWNKNATRAEMAYLFANADTYGFMPNEDFPMTDIPDVTTSTPFANEILYLYRSGIAAGSDEHYTYNPNANIRRSEVSALISRICMLGERIDLPKG
ncbi:MAG: S-layer homology domain-containing protein, partial [Anaerovoracaceae bacterium]